MGIAWLYECHASGTADRDAGTIGFLRQLPCGAAFRTGAGAVAERLPAGRHRKTSNSSYRGIFLPNGARRWRNKLHLHQPPTHPNFRCRPTCKADFSPPSVRRNLSQAKPCADGLAQVRQLLTQVLAQQGAGLESLHYAPSVRGIIGRLSFRCASRMA